MRKVHRGHVRIEREMMGGFRRDGPEKARRKAERNGREGGRNCERGHRGSRGI